jgi:hypothetical protein
MFKEALRLKISKQHNAIVGLLYAAERKKDIISIEYYTKIEKELREWLNTNR